MQKIPVTILGATGLVGQKLVELLAHHPWFSIDVLAASEHSVGKHYIDAITHPISATIPEELKQKRILPCFPSYDTPIVFSALSGAIAQEIEILFASEGYHVISNAKNFRMQNNVPLIIPEANAEHIKLIEKQTTAGKIITNPNCVVAGLALALKPLAAKFGLTKVHVVTFQAISGAGLNNLGAYDIADNIIPYIAEEEDKIETETKKILGSLTQDGITFYPIDISAQCNRVPVSNGHFMNVSVQFENKVQPADVISCWNEFNQTSLNLPSLNYKPLVYFDQPNMPQPKHHRDLGTGMSVSLGHLRPCSILDYKFNLLVNNLVRGAAGGALLNAELFVKHYSSLIQNYISTPYLTN